MDDKPGNTITFMWHAGSIDGSRGGEEPLAWCLGAGFLEGIP